jgi:hypothetical protein
MPAYAAMLAAPELLVSSPCTSPEPITAPAAPALSQGSQPHNTLPALLRSLSLPQVGPDSDGLLNFPAATEHPDASPAAAAAVAAAVPGEALDEVLLPPQRMDLQHLLDSVCPGADLSEAAVPPGIKSTPKPFQLQVRPPKGGGYAPGAAARHCRQLGQPCLRLLPIPPPHTSLALLQGLEWMLRREMRSDAAGRGLLALHPQWLQLVAAGGEVLHVSSDDGLISRAFTPAPVPKTCGGFLCDEVGRCERDRACGGAQGASGCGHARAMLGPARHKACCHAASSCSAWGRLHQALLLLPRHCPATADGPGQVAAGADAHPGQPRAGAVGELQPSVLPPAGACRPPPGAPAASATAPHHHM